jgi:hypothetical protein
VLNGNGLTVINYRSSNNGKKSTSNSNKSTFTGTSIAVFSDELSYRSYNEALEIQVENWENAFLAQWGYLNEDDLNAKEEELNFDSERPLTEFENQIGLQSLRKQYLLAEETWLNNNVLDVTADPDNNPIYDFDESEMAVMNTLAEVQIGTTIIKKLTDKEVNLINNQITIKNANSKNQKTMLIKEDATLMIKESDYDALIDFNNGDYSVINNNNVSITNSTTTTSCKYAEEVRAEIGGGSDKFCKILIKVPSPSFGWNGKVKSKIVSYKKGFLGWRKWRTSIATGARGNVYSANCDNSPTYINKSTGTRKKKKQVYTWRNKSFGSHKVENGGMTGLFTYNNVVKELKLTW